MFLINLLGGVEGETLFFPYPTNRPSKRTHSSAVESMITSTLLFSAANI